MAHTHKQNKNFITFLLIFSLLLFLYLIRDYLMTMALAIIFTGLLFPFFTKMTQWLKGRKNLAAVLVTIMFLLVIVIPTMFILMQIVSEAGQITESILPWLEKQIANPNPGDSLPEWFPFREELLPYSKDIQAKAGDLIGKIGGNILSGVGSFTQSTLNFVVHLFIMLYALFYFLLNGKQILTRFADFLPISNNVFETIKNQLYNTSIATIKGAVVIGFIQGALVGVSFWIAGIDGAIFWAAVAALASLIPSVGCALIYVPAGAYLLATGMHWQGVFVLLWGFLIVGTVDNILRPILVGRDTKISELTILLSTLGGIGLFGLSGVILGPMIASLFITMSNIYLKENG